MSLEIHDKTVANLQKQIRQVSTRESYATLSRNGESNTTRANYYKAQGSSLSLRDFNQVLQIDAEKKSALVEPSITMEQLVKSTLKQQLIPKVVPEFKGITAGGAVMGAALESSSLRHGQFDDICSEYQVILGDGSLIKTNAKNHPDLFFGLSSSYGTLGLLTSLEIQLAEAPKYFTLTYKRFNDISRLIESLNALCLEGSSVDYIEGLVFSERDGLIIEAKPSSDREIRTLKTGYVFKTFTSWFVQHAYHTSDGQQELIPTLDYLFRYDRGAFWMGYYALQPRFLWPHLVKKPRLFLEKIKKTQAQPPQNLLSARLLSKLAGPFMDSQKLYASLHAVPENWFAKTFVVQDFYIPQTKVKAFIEKTLDETAITPLWLCPVRPGKSMQFLSPHYPSTDLDSSCFINTGVYGIPRTGKSSIDATRTLEHTVKELGGRKMLYSQSYYSPEEFWEIYPKKNYLELREKYHANTWVSLEDKVLSKISKT